MHVMLVSRTRQDKTRHLFYSLTSLFLLLKPQRTGILVPVKSSVSDSISENQSHVFNNATTLYSAILLFNSKEFQLLLNIL